MKTFSATGVSLIDSVLCVSRCCNLEDGNRTCSIGKEQFSPFHLQRSTRHPKNKVSDVL